MAIYFSAITSAYKGAVYYSASGNFADTTTLAVFDPTGAPYNTEDQWFVDQTVSFGPGDVTGGFTDTAKVRWGKGPGTTGMGTRVYFDDVVITGIGGVSPPDFQLTISPATSPASGLIWNGRARPGWSTGC